MNKYFISLLPLPILMPGLINGVVFWAWFFGYIIDRSIRFKVDKHFLIFVVLFSILVMVQAVFYSESSKVLTGNLTDVSLRNNGTLGEYSVSGKINLYFFAKLILFSYFFSLISKSDSFRILTTLKYLLFLAVGLQSGLTLISIFGGSAMSAVTALGPSSNNFLVGDQFGARISLFFHEPSQMGVVIGSLLGAWLVKNASLRKIFLVCGFLLFFIVTSRSLSVLFVFVSFVTVIKASRYAVLFGFVFCLVFFRFSRPVLESLITLYPGYQFLFRSSGERLFMPVDFFSDFSGLLIGYDFGQIYYFPPVYGIVSQVGIIGFFLFLVLFRFDLKVLMFFVLISFVSPQLWFHISFVAAAIFSAAVSRKRHSF